jgi:hypothetical protein
MLSPKGSLSGMRRAPKGAHRKAVNEASPVGRFVVGSISVSLPLDRPTQAAACGRSLPQQVCGGHLSIVPPRQLSGKIIFYPLHFPAEALGLAALARTGRLHSAAVGDIVVL